MAWTITDDVHEFLAAAGDWLRSNTAKNTIMLTVSEALRVGSGPAPTGVPVALGWWSDSGGRVAGTCLHTPPYSLVLTTMPPGAAAELAGRLADEPRVLSQVTGDQPAVEAFVDAWLARHPGATTTVAMSQRLYRLGDLVPPATPGDPRLAAAADRDLLCLWFAAFRVEMGEPDHGDVERAVQSVLSYRGWTLWTVDGAPMSMCTLSRQVNGMVRVGGAYTPPEHRGHGYGTAVVATASQRARDEGATEVLLFTDLANPTSNAACQRIGFRAVQDIVVIDLHH